MDAHDSHRIGHAAKLLGVTPRTLRHYDELGLVAPSRRTVGGARRYATDDLDRLRLVIALAMLDIPLAEIPPMLELLDLAAQATTLPAGHLERLDAINADIRERIEVFQRRADTINHLNDRLPELP